MRFFVVLFFLSLFFFFPQSLRAVDVGTGVVGDSLSLASTSLLPSAARIINILVSFLALVALIVIIYGGTRWLLAAGDEKEISLGKKTIVYGICGLFIILISWGLTSFLMEKIADSTGTEISSKQDNLEPYFEEGQEEEAATLPCTPQCIGRTCGDDGCDGSCGFCAPNEFCNQSSDCEEYFSCLGGEMIYNEESPVHPSDFVCGVSTVAYGGGPYNASGMVRNMGGYYRTVQVGEQCWLRDNMNVGVRIDSCPTGNCAPGGIGNTANDTPNQIQKYCKDELESNCDIYGGLYNWPMAMQLPWPCFSGIWNGSNCNPLCNASSLPNNPDKRRGICPPGWHIPTDWEQWQLGLFYSNSTNCPQTGGGAWCSPAGDYLKKAEDCSLPGDSRCGASGLDLALGGGRGNDGVFYYFGAGYFWNATQNAAHDALNRDTSVGANDTWWRNSNSKLWSWPVRCIKD